MPAPDVPIYACRRLPRPIEIDGDLRKPAWRAVAAAPLKHATGSPEDVRQPTVFRACWCDTHLYLSFECADTDIWGTHARRDAALYDEEVVEAFLCPTGDVRRYYELEWSPLGVVFDAAVHSPNRSRRGMDVDTAWECRGMDVAVRATGPVRLAPPSARVRRRAPAPHRAGARRGWWVEVGIPFSAVPEVKPPVPGTEWRADFYRIDRGETDEYTAWSPTMKTPANFHVPDRFGRLVFSG